MVRKLSENYFKTIRKLFEDHPNRSEYEPKNVVSGLKFAAKLINKKDWHMVEKVGGTSGDLMARGVCPKCDINLVGKEPRPRDFTLPCLIKGCTFNKKNNTKAIQ